MKFLRLIRHLATTRWSTRRHFTPQVRDAIEQAIAAAKRIMPGDPLRRRDRLRSAELWRDLPPRQRALQLFGQLGVWTRRTTTCPDLRAHGGPVVEIIADRGIAARVAQPEWSGVPADGAALPRRALSRGLDRGYRGRGALLGRHFPGGTTATTSCRTSPCAVAHH